jgi:EmrB/QacA subfamily drug resistance transporter
MATLDTSIVHVALPTLSQALHADLPQIKWVVIGYLMVITVTLLPFGRLADQWGRRKVVASGFIVFTVGSLLCGIASDFLELLWSRMIQGIGAGMLMANGPAIITAAFSTLERGRALGILSMVVSAGLVSGPSIGGFLIGTLGWRSIFLVNIPFGILGLIGALSFLPRDPKSSKGIQFDFRGAILQFGILFSFIFVVDPPTIPWEDLVFIKLSRPYYLAIFSVLFLLFLREEKRAHTPLFDLSLLKIRNFSLANISSFLTFVAHASVNVLMPFFLERVLQYSTTKAGLLLTAIPLTIFFVAPMSGHLSDRLGSRWLSAMGSFVGLMGFLSLAGMFGMGVGPEMTRPQIVFSLAVLGLALGLFQAPNNNSIMSVVPTDKLGAASSLLATIRNLGFVTGTGLSTAILKRQMDATQDFSSGFRSVLLVAAFLISLAMVSSLMKREKPRISQ